MRGGDTTDRQDVSEASNVDQILAYEAGAMVVEAFLTPMFIPPPRAGPPDPGWVSLGQGPATPRASKAAGASLPQGLRERGGHSDSGGGERRGERLQLLPSLGPGALPTAPGSGPGPHGSTFLGGTDHFTIPD